MFFRSSGLKGGPLRVEGSRGGRGREKKREKFAVEAHFVSLPSNLCDIAGDSRFRFGFGLNKTVPLQRDSLGEFVTSLFSSCARDGGLPTVRLSRRTK